ncbi:hypothetical protein QE152_g8126 [Popillia japonica]|uniref:Uncharacterized protein n=1 Tax=Popillia japonica TaxID=7064 RepID=A0AAW1MDC7_POPJA
MIGTLCSSYCRSPNGVPLPELAFRAIVPESFSQVDRNRYPESTRVRADGSFRWYRLRCVRGSFVKCRYSSVPNRLGYLDDKRTHK